MTTLAFVFGCVLIAVVLWEAFETIVSPRRVSRRFRLTRAFYRATWIPWRALGARLRDGRPREAFLAVFGPSSLLMLLALWTGLLVVGFMLIQYGSGDGIQSSTGRHGLATDLYASGATVFTLTPGDIVPKSTMARVITVLEAGSGLAFLALVIGYLPTLSQAFSRREVNVSLLDARAGSPPTAGALLLRNSGSEPAVLERMLEKWEPWCAELLETHVTFPVLAYYRSQHANQSWVAALSAILDACALVMVSSETGAKRAARLTFAIARHAVVDLALQFRLAPKPALPDRLPTPDFGELRSALRDAGLAIDDRPEVEGELRRLRALYEPYVNALGAFLMMPLPGWRSPQGARDNWRGLA